MSDTIDSRENPSVDRTVQAVRRGRLLSAAAAWVGMVGLAILNATVRELLVTPTAGDYVGHVVSTATLLVVLAGSCHLYFGRVSDHTRRELAVVGVLWAGLTVAFELLFGLYVAGDSLAALLALYDLTQGYVWVFVPLFLLAAPALFGRTPAR